MKFMTRISIALMQRYNGLLFITKHFIKRGEGEVSSRGKHAFLDLVLLAEKVG